MLQDLGANDNGGSCVKFCMYNWRPHKACSSNGLGDSKTHPSSPLNLVPARPRTARSNARCDGCPSHQRASAWALLVMNLFTGLDVTGCKNSGTISLRLWRPAMPPCSQNTSILSRRLRPSLWQHPRNRKKLKENETCWLTLTDTDWHRHGSSAYVKTATTWFKWETCNVEDYSKNLENTDSTNSRRMLRVSIGWCMQLYLKEGKIWFSLQAQTRLARARFNLQSNASSGVTKRHQHSEAMSSYQSRWCCVSSLLSEMRLSDCSSHQGARLLDDHFNRCHVTCPGLFGQKIQHSKQFQFNMTVDSSSQGLLNSFLCLGLTCHWSREFHSSATPQESRSIRMHTTYWSGKVILWSE